MNVILIDTSLRVSLKMVNPIIEYRSSMNGLKGTDMYLLDNSIQLDTAIEDFEYTKWLDPDPEVAAYAHNAT